MVDRLLFTSRMRKSIHSALKPIKGTSRKLTLSTYFKAFALRARASDRWRATKKHKTCFAAVVWTQRRFELIGLAAWSPGGYAGTAKASYCSALKSVKGPWLQSDSLSRFSPALCSGVRASRISRRHSHNDSKAI